jgi:protein gp37
MNKTGIEYMDLSWNPIAMRCTPASEGCANCWHLRMADRLAGNTKLPDDVRAAYAGDGPPVRIAERLEQPLKRKKSAVIGVQFMGDLFHEDVPDEFIRHVFQVMGKCEQHVFQVLTKRPERMRNWINEYVVDRDGNPDPFPHIWLGVTVENADNLWRVPELLQTPAAVRFVSCEPLLGPIIVKPCLTENKPRRWYRGIDWVIAGGESGPGARPMHPDWARSLRDQCQAAGVAFFLKQAIIDGRMVKLPELDGKQWREFPNAIQRPRKTQESPAGTFAEAS